MSIVSVSAEIPCSPLQVWQLIGNLSSLSDLHPDMKDMEASEIGLARKLTLGDGGIIVEHLEQISDESMTYRYRIHESPLPVRGYVSELKVTSLDDGQRCRVDWSGEFETAGFPECEISRLIKGVYVIGLVNLAQLMVARTYKLPVH